MSPIQRIKSFDSTGVAPNGRLYAGDLNAIQDAAAGQTDASQTLLLGTLQVGDTGIQALKFGAEIMRITSHLMVDKTVHLGNLTTTARDALTSGKAPKGALLFNTTVGFPQINIGTDGARNWMTVGDINQTFMDAKGDLIVGTGSDTAARLAIGANGTGPVADSTQTTGIRWGAPVLNTVSAYLTSDVNLSPKNTFFDAVQISCAAGVWFLYGSVLVLGPPSGEDLTLKLHDGTNVASMTQMRSQGNVRQTTAIAGVVSPGTTTNYKISCAATDNVGPPAIKASGNSNFTDGTNKATYLIGVQIG